jgi:hypothetical protein
MEFTRYPTTSGDEFELRATRVLIDYIIADLDKEDLIKHLEEIFDDNIIFIRCAHYRITTPVASIDKLFPNKQHREKALDLIKGDEKAIAFTNTHAFVELAKRVNIRDYDQFIFDGECPDIYTIRTKKEADRVKWWFGDIDIQNLDIAKPEPLFDRVAKCKTESEALTKYAPEAKDVSGIITLFAATRAVNMTKKFTYEPNLPWQREFLHEFLETDGDYRKIIWVYDSNGNNGKTMLGKWLSINHHNDWVLHNDLGTSRDSATIINGSIKTGWTGKGICINFPRKAENHDRIYDYIEMIKDGVITQQKYYGGTNYLDNPHVVCFSNFLPHTTSMSVDRWDVREITEGGNWRRLSLREVLKKQKEHQDAIYSEDSGRDQRSIIASLSKKTPKKSPIRRGTVKRTPIRTPTKKSKTIIDDATGKSAMDFINGCTTK